MVKNFKVGDVLSESSHYVVTVFLMKKVKIEY